MLVDLYPRVHRRYTSLPILGPILDGYGTWLLQQGYSTDRAREHFRAAPRLVRGLQQHDVQSLTSLTRARLWACAPTDSQEDPELTVLVRQMTRYCESELSLYPPPALTRIEQRVATYRTYLQQVRGFAPSTLTHHAARLASFWRTWTTRRTRPGSPRSSARISTPSCVPSVPASRVHPYSMWWATSAPSFGSSPLPARSRPGSTRRSTRLACIAASSSHGRCPGNGSVAPPVD